MGTQNDRLDDGSFEHPKHMFNLMGKKMVTILALKKLLNWPYGLPIVSLLQTGVRSAVAQW